MTHIDDDAFSGCSGLETVMLPASVVSMGQGVFGWCSRLTAITVDAANPSFVSLDGVLFNHSRTSLIGCPAGRAGNYLIPPGVTTIEDDAFRGCRGLSSVTFPAGLTMIGANAFSGCFNLTSVALPYGLTRIGDRAFELCALTGLTLPATVTNIGDAAFAACANLPDFFIPSSVLTIGELPFDGCSSLASITVDPDNPNFSSSGGALYDKSRTLFYQCPAGMTGSYVIACGVTHIGDSAFSGCAGLTSVSIPAGVTHIGNQAFLLCAGLQSVTLPASVTTIGDSAFYGCDLLTSVSIPDGVDVVGSWAFYGCDSLTHVMISASVTHLGDHAFYQCRDLTMAVFAGNAPAMDEGVFDLASDDFKVCFFAGRTGFTTPTWMGYPAVAMVDPASVELTTVAVHGSVLPPAGTYEAGANLQLTATPEPGYVFGAWAGDAVGHDNPLSLLMDADKQIIANFLPDTADDDGDGLSNYDEIVTCGTDPNHADIDDDGLNDGAEIAAGSNPLLADTDGDGFNDGFEVGAGFNPVLAASTPDGLCSLRIVPGQAPAAVELRFNAARGAIYQIEDSSDLLEWKPVESDILGQSAVVSRTYPMQYPPRRFFRIGRN